MLFRQLVPKFSLFSRLGKDESTTHDRVQVWPNRELQKRLDCFLDCLRETSPSTAIQPFLVLQQFHEFIPHIQLASLNILRGFWASRK